MVRSDRPHTESRLGNDDGDRVVSGDDLAPERDPTILDADEFGFHVDDPEAGGGDEVPDEVAETDTDVVDAFAEAFNARDLDELLEILAPDGEAPGLLGGDRDNLPAAIESLWHRRPTCCVTRGRIDEAVVGVLWEHDGSAWWSLAVVHVDDIDEDGRIGVVEFSEDPALLDEVEVDGPDQDLEEGSRWVEWDEGAD